MATWIEDDSDVIDAIESAKEEWFSAHADEKLAPTSEVTDEDINDALGLPRSGALRNLSDEFADWSEDEVRAAVARGLDAWAGRE